MEAMMTDFDDRWGPITQDFPPRDGREFLAYERRVSVLTGEPYDAYYICYWAEDPDPLEPNGWIDMNSDIWGATPSHWQPLRPPRK